MSSTGSRPILIGNSLYIGEFTQALHATQAWIVTSWITDSVNVVTIMTTPPTHTQPPSKSEGEYEAPGLDNAPQEDFLTPCQLVSNVLHSDQVEHTLDKGAWCNACHTPGMEDF